MKDCGITKISEYKFWGITVNVPNTNYLQCRRGGVELYEC